MKTFLTDQFGNAASTNHPYGWSADQAVKDAREQVAHLISCKPKEVIFTSGATESINLALLGSLKQLPPQKGHLITSNVEHSATLKVAEAAEKLGYQVTRLPANQYGQVSPEQVLEALRPETVVVSLIYANNEIGSINPITQVADVLKDKKVLFHVDASQAVGKIEINLQTIPIHLMSFSAHKIYGPKGIGALYVRSKNPRVRLKPLTFGSDQEMGLHPGTSNVPGIVALGKACELIKGQIENENSKLAAMRDHLWSELQSQIPTAQLNGHPTERLSNNLTFSMPDALPNVFWSSLDGLAVSSGSACATGSTKASHVLTSIGLDSQLSRSTVRIGVGRFNTQEEISTAIDILVRAYKKSSKI